MQRTFSVGGTISESLSIYMKNFVPFSALALIVLSPIVVWSLLASTMEVTTMTLLIPLALQTLLGYVVTGTLVYGVYQDMRGQRASLGQCITVGFSRLLPVIGVALVVGFLTALGTLALVVPGIILMCMWFLAIPVAIVERAGIGDSMSRSSTLTKGHRWSIFGIVIILVIIGGIAGAVTELVLPSTTTLGIIVSVVVTALFSAWGACAQAVGYHDLRATKEGVDIQSIASVFD